MNDSALGSLDLDPYPRFIEHTPGTHAISFVYVMNDLDHRRLGISCPHPTGRLAACRRAACISTSSVGSCFPVFSGFSFYVVFSSICISDLLLTIPELYDLFQVLRLIDSFTVKLSNLIITMLKVFGFYIAFLGTLRPLPQQSPPPSP
ncbi:hypothetical protein MRX96_026648 [Rhipicephalus microplus]